MNGSSGRALAVLASAAAALAAAGCLLPQDIEEAEVAPEVVNDPPRIVPDTATVDGLSRARYTTQADCGTAVFRVGVVRDLDAADDLELRWFVNYDRGGASIFPEKDPVVLRGGQDVVDGIRQPSGDEFVLELDRYRGETVVVEVWVSDGFDDDELEPRWRRVRSGKDADSFTWIVEVTAEAGACAR